MDIGEKLLIVGMVMSLWIIDLCGMIRNTHIETRVEQLEEKIKLLEVTNNG